ncbi:putative endonuclease/exonuclease/phosphatase family protein [Bifidobacterium adolescentis ATCC 15703]|uniref:Endonuclease/exonuclease/phosphatase family protein n=1 Tax=Bifidobacterium adolescentis (strain ATCC 15703 / DSM 20083 / NCTC 11814 / E194a) TaxID=367928 RepID=A1A1Y9_BIFAA|nr:putative endonuclease/exonuclease/phosphatase family protein [Bifidobacterium adolescentis ATCC 15703]
MQAPDRRRGPPRTRGTDTGPPARPGRHARAPVRRDGRGRRRVPTPVRGVQTRLRRAGPSPPPADAVRVRPSRRNAQLAGHGRRHGHASPRHVPVAVRHALRLGHGCDVGRMRRHGDAGTAARLGRRTRTRREAVEGHHADHIRGALRTRAVGGVRGRVPPVAGSRPSRRGSGGWTPPPGRTMRCRRPARFATIRSWRAACARRPSPRRTTACGIRAPIVRRTCPDRRRRTGRRRRGRSR